MELNKVHHGDCLSLFKELEDESIDCVITSPPYWQLRDYKWDGQWGLEPTFQLYLEHLWQMMDEVHRILKDNGTVWVNLGDTYSGSNGAGSPMTKWDGLYEGESLRNKSGRVDTVPSKCLLLIPHRFAIGCIDRGWIVRNDIIWAKRNGMPESVTDRFSKKHEYFFLMAKQEKYYFDLDGIRDDQKQVSIERYKRGVNVNKYTNGAEGQSAQGICQPRPNISKRTNTDMFGEYVDKVHKNIKGDMDVNGQSRTTAGLSMKKAEDKINELGKNPGSVSDFWDVPTQPSSDEHYAAYNDLLIGKPIVAGCPQGGTILDPFAGTATTGCRALELGRNFIGFEGSKKYVEMANKNILPYIKQQKLF